MQFSLRTLFGLLGFTAIFCVAMLNAGPAWVMVLRGVALGSLLFALLAIWYRRAEQRAFWVGYLHGGGAYALLTLYALGAFTEKPVWNDDQIASGEIATVVYRWLPEAKRQAELGQTVWKSGRLMLRNSGVVLTISAAPPDFRYIFHAATIVLCGWIGGLVCVWLYRTRGDTTPQRAIPPGAPGALPPKATPPAITRDSK